MGGLLETACFLLPQRRQRILASYYSTLLSSPLPACRIAGVGDIGFLHAPFALTWTCTLIFPFQITSIACRPFLILSRSSKRQFL